MWRENLRRYVDELANGNMKAVSLKAGLGETAVRDLLDGRAKSPTLDTIRKLAHALGISVSDIVGDTDRFREPTYVRVVGGVAAGYWRDVTYTDFETYEIPVLVDPRWPADAVFALEVAGNSINRRARDGDWVLCLRADCAPRPFQDGDWVIVEQLDHGKVETTVKRVKWNNGWELWPDSDDPQFQKPIRLENRKGTEVRVTAFVLDFISPATKL